MTIETARSFFLWCTVINYAMLVWWAVLCRFAHDWVLRFVGQWVRVSSEHFAVLNFAGMMLYKVGIFLFNLVPCIVLYII